MDGLYRDIVRALKDSTKFGRTFVKSVYPERRDINGGMMVKKNNKYETRLDRANAVYTGGKTLKNAFQEAGVKISDEDVRVCMIKFAFSSQPDIKWFFGKDKYEDPVWAFSRVKPDPTVQKTAKSKIEKSYADKNYKGREVFKSGNTTIYKLF